VSRTGRNQSLPETESGSNEWHLVASSQATKSDKPEAIWAGPGGRQASLPPAAPAGVANPASRTSP